MPPKKEDYDDAALARALQEEYEREYRRRGMEQHLRRDDTAWPATTSPATYPTAPTAEEVFDMDRTSFFSNHNPTGFFDEVEIGDDGVYTPREQERVLAQIRRQQEKKQKKKASRSSQDPYGSSTAGLYSGPPISEVDLTKNTHLTEVTTGFEMSEDEALARRLEQELRDEELARNVAAQDQVRRIQPISHAPPSRCCGFGCAVRKCVCSMVTLVLVAVVAVALLYVFGVTDRAGFIPTYEDFRGEDPFNNANPEDANLWRTNRSGLRLTIINALEEKWHANFFKAVNEWDVGTPDALSLTTEISRPDAVCRAEKNKAKVCNGNYGATKWRGINKVLLENRRIYSSAARMNDYYVKDSDVAQKQYTMCHEIGHAFGLPHTDEDFYNRDLFNCMDYTRTPENNMQPAEPNFKFLATLYGTIDGSIQPGGAVETAQNVGPDDDEDDKGNKKNKNKNNRSLERKVLPPEIELALDEIDAIVDSGELSNTKREGWRRLHFSVHGEAHEINLGNGFVVQLHLLGV